MTQSQIRLTALLTAFCWPILGWAQETSASEDQRIEQLVRAEASEWYTPKDSVTVGFRVLGSGANVRFGNLGSVAFSSVIAPASAGSVNRTYDNGYVSTDAPRTTTFSEVDINGNQTSTPGGRYQSYTTSSSPVTDANGNVIGNETVQVLSGDSVSYTPGLTRVWSYYTPEQAAERPGYVAFSSYSATSDNESRSKKQGMSAGVELQFAHALRKIGKKSELSIVAGIGLNSISSKTSGDVHSTLHTYTDYYSLNGQTAPTTDLTNKYAAPSRPDGVTETTVAISTQPDSTLTTNVTTPGAATVHGLWKIKGAYFMMKVGPSLRSQITDRFSMNASLGIAGAYAGTNYSALETMEVPIVGTTITDPATSSDTTKFLFGYYADFNMEWAANDTMGLYGGLSAQKFGNYNQTLGERTARIDLGTSAGLRGGINIRF